MAMQVAAKVVDFDRMAQLLERLRVSDPKAERWTAAFDELRDMVSAQLDASTRRDDAPTNVVSIASLTPAA